MVLFDVITHDLRTELAGVALQHQRRPNGPYERRTSPPTSVTVHFNGPVVEAPLRAHPANYYRWITKLHTEKVWGRLPDGSPLYGSGIMYHLGIGAAGEVLLLRDLDRHLWHCGNGTGNATSIAIQFGLGGNQAPTGPQWVAFERLVNVLLQTYNLPRAAVFGHREWPRNDGAAVAGTWQSGQGPCPGEQILSRLRPWRVETLWPGPGAYRVQRKAWLRQGPGQQFARAHNGNAVPFVLQPGDVVDLDAVVIGSPVAGERRWAHTADGRGFTLFRDGDFTQEAC